MARRLGKSRPAIANTLRLLALPDTIKAMLADARLSAGHARALLAAPESARGSLAQRAASEGLTVRALERLAGAAADARPKAKRARLLSADEHDFESRLRERFGTRSRSSVSAAAAASSFAFKTTTNSCASATSSFQKNRRSSCSYRFRGLSQSLWRASFASESWSAVAGAPQYRARRFHRGRLYRLSRCKRDSMATHAPARVTRAARAELLHGIYVILDDGPQTTALARAVLEAGVRIVQYRAKNGIRSDCARALRDLTRERDSLLILNDDWRAALQYECDGVHLGPSDDGFAATAPVRDAMADRLIGLSCGTAGEIRDAGDVDYLGVGPVFETSSKPDAGRPLGVAELRRLASASPLPVAAIGGISLARLGNVRRSGVAMAAVISAVASSSDPFATAAALVSGWNAGG